MTTVLLIIHLFVTIALIGVVLIQRSEGGGLGIGTSQGMGAFMSGRGTANLLTRTTAILAAIFFALSLTLALLNRGTSGVGRSILDVPPAQSSGAPPALPAAPGPNAPPAVPSGGGIVPGARPAPSAPASGATPAPAGAPAPSAPAQSAPAPNVPTN
jgi:preprotein translocase subunit SecG